MDDQSQGRRFVRNYNLRRRLAKALCAAVVVLFILRALIASDERRWADIGILVAGAAFLCADFILCKCPACSRFIGLKPAFISAMPRGAPCAMENQNFKELDWPDEGDA